MMAILLIALLVWMINQAQALSIQYPSANSVIDAEKALAIYWVYNETTDADRALVYFINNSTQVSREMAINVEVPAQTFALPPFVGTVPDGDGYQVQFQPMPDGLGIGGVSDVFSIVNSTNSQTTATAVTTSVSAATSVSTTTSTLNSTSTSTSTSNLNTTASTTTGSSRTTSAVPNDTGDASDSSRLTTGEDVGIGLGAVVGVSLIAIGVGLLCYRQKHMLKQKLQQKQPASEVDPVPELPMHHGIAGATAYEFYELSGNNMAPTELPGSTDQIYELPTEGLRHKSL